MNKWPNKITWYSLLVANILGIWIGVSLARLSRGIEMAGRIAWIVVNQHRIVGQPNLDEPPITPYLIRPCFFSMLIMSIIVLMISYLWYRIKVKRNDHSKNYPKGEISDEKK